MMISVQTGGLEELYGIDGAYQAIKEAGFDGADANVDHLIACNDIRQGRHALPFDAEGDACLKFFQPWKDGAEKYGIQNTQAHAPFPSHIYEGGAFNEYLLEALKKTIMGCEYIGCPRLIVHPFFFGYQNRMTPEEEWQLNLKQYAALIPAAKKHHVTICLENMFTSYRGKIIGACCSDLEIACRYVDTLNDMAGEKCFGFCLDTGHLLLLGKDIKESIIQMGDRIEAFHVHDNNGVSDQHLAPYMGVMDWNRFVEGLQAIHYQKPLSFETFNTMNVVDPALAKDFLALIAKTGRLFASRAEG